MSACVQWNVGTLTWNHCWLERIGRTETDHTLGVNVSCAIHWRLRCGAQFQHDARDATDPAFQYQWNLTPITLQSAL